jgi:ABC-type molybdate transport system ATPase subunit
VTAVKNPNGQIVVVMVNGGAVMQAVVLQWGDQKLQFQIESQTVASINWN